MDELLAIALGVTGLAVGYLAYLIDRHHKDLRERLDRIEQMLIVKTVFDKTG
jgi:hypothetical protein